MPPTTQWIKDSGTVLDQTTGYLVDELGNYFVDELSQYLADSQSTDGNALPASWGQDEELPTSWADSNEARTATYTRTTVQGDTRVTVQGATRVANTSDNRQLPTAWVGEYA